MVEYLECLRIQHGVELQGQEMYILLLVMRTLIYRAIGSHWFLHTLCEMKLNLLENKNF